MRPLPGNSATSANGASVDVITDPFLASGASSQMTFILTDEASIDAPLRPTTSSNATRRKGDIYKTVPCPMVGSSSSSASSESSCSLPSATEPRPSSSRRQSPNSQAGPTSAPTSAPMTPSMTDLSAPPSGLSSPASCRDSLAASLSEDQGSFILSTLDDSGLDHAPPLSVKEQDLSADSQLIMPTISVPTRRPFTSEGKSMGRLKILVAGHAGLGKTSLIQAIVQSCQHIIHVDPAVPATGEEGRSATFSTSREVKLRLSTMTETFASTKPYPSWWRYPDMPTNRRRSVGDVILERNICFVDTPGLDVTSQALQSGPEISRYVERHLQKSALRGLGDSQVLSTLSSGGGLLVDVILYMIPSTGLTRAEFGLLRQLSPLTNIIPILAQADTLDSVQIEAGKALIYNQLIEKGIDTFSFDNEAVGDGEHPVYAVSSKAGADHEVMDASLLMSSEYIPPLVETDLAALVRRLLSAEGSLQLRHSTLTKLLTWRKSTPPDSMTTGTGVEMMHFHSPEIGSIVTRRTATQYDHGAAQWSRVRFVNWAADLQRSLLNERLSYDECSMRQQALWARDQARLRSGGSCASALAPRQSPENGSSRPFRRRNTFTKDSTWRGAPQQDPLGLIELGTRFKHNSWHTFELLGSVGLVGGVAVWALS